MASTARTTSTVSKEDPVDDGQGLKNVVVSVDDMDPDTVCGIGSFKPQWLQSWATARTYLFFYSAAGVIQGSYYTYFIGTMSTLEKRYAFKSKISGSVMMLDEILPLALGIFIGYYGGKTHRPRLVAIGMFLSVICCFMTAFPYFLYGTAQHLQSSEVLSGVDNNYCDKGNVQECNKDDRPPTFVAVACLFVGSFFKGFGNIAYYVVGWAYMDDTAKKKNTPIYYAISTCLRLMGPVVGFLMSSAFLKYYEDPSVDPGFGPEDPRWVGAWWVGFVVQGFLLFFTTAPLLLFPRRLPKRGQISISNATDISQGTLWEIVKDMLKTLKRLFKNRLYILLTVADICGALAAFGFFLMLPKYMENQFRVTASAASLFSGPPGIVAIQISTFVGALIMWKWQPAAKYLIVGNAILQFIGALAFLALMPIACEDYVFPGTAVVDGEYHLQNECNAGCNCTTSILTPVCGPDGISTYFSPCYAGCSSGNTTSDDENFLNCSCIYDEENLFHLSSSAKKGFCSDDNCNSQLLAFIIGIFFVNAITSVMHVVHVILLLRSVDPVDKSAALGLFETLVSAFEALPFPIIFGAFMDSACVVWEESCGETGNCWLYDLKKYKYLIHGIPAFFLTSSGISYVATYFLADGVRNLYKDEDVPELKPKKLEIPNATRL